MAITVDVQDNPTIINVGKKASDATIINSGYSSGITTYQILKWPELTTITLTSLLDITQYAQIVSISAATLEIILDFRGYYGVRVRNSGDGDTWSDLATFKTRDKSYKTPSAISQDIINPVYGTTLVGRKTRIEVLNVGKSIVEYTAHGATVTNSDKGSNQTESLTYTDSGATVVNKDTTPY